MKMKRPKIPFIEAKEKGRVALVGFPLDATFSYRPGAGMGLEAIREVSEVLEAYSPYLELSLEDLSFEDRGDLSPSRGSLEGCLAQIQGEVEGLLKVGKTLLALGGEHLITLPLVKAHLGSWPGLVVVHLDAHMDLRDEYEGRSLSHATVMRRVWEEVDGRVYQLGIRSGTREEWGFSRQHCRLCPYNLSRLQEYLREIGDTPIYLTIDLDIVDPGYFPGTGTPESGGITPQELFSTLPLFLGKNLVGADVVELSPAYDPTGASSILAAKVVREMLLLLQFAQGAVR
jgi:agmatinase